MLARLDEVGGTDIGRQHGLFDQAVRLGAHARDDLVDAPVVVADDLRLGGLEVDRTAAGTLLEQEPVDLVQMQQMRHQMHLTLRLGTTGVGEHGRHFGVGQPRMRADHGGVELVGRDLPLGIHQHVADHRQPVLVRVERTQAVGELLRQHRNDTARKVDRGRTLVGVVVQRIARLDVMADVRDGHQQSPALLATDLGWLAVHGIVEVARVLAVDRHQRHIGQVDPVLHVGRAHLVRQLAGLREGLGREAVRHFVFAHGDLDLHAGVVDVTEHLGDPPHWLRVQRRRLRQLDRHHLPGLCAGRRVLGDQDVLPITLVLWCDHPRAILEQQPADDRCLAALQNFQHPPLGTALAVEANDPHAHPVVVQDGAHFLRRQIDVDITAVDHHEAMSVPVPLHRANGFIRQSTVVQRKSLRSVFV